MSLCILIKNFVNNILLKCNDNETLSVNDMKNDPYMRMMSKYIRGGISKLTKIQLKTLTDAMINYKENCFIINQKEIIPDAEQIIIIKSPNEHNIRVIAGAGTGKTTTISCRIKHLLDTQITPDKLLVLTFNIESKKNLEKMMDGLMGFEIKIEIRTIDSFCYKIKKDFNDEFKNDNNIMGCSLRELGITGRKIMEKYGKEICSQYKYVFFDEFQDIDQDQYHILKTFEEQGCKLTVIGDDSQNIYQFRGSDNHYLINFDKIFPNTLTYKITTNYRSTKEIIDLANDSIVNNKEKIYKLMKPYKKETGKIDLIIHKTGVESVKYLIDMIKYYTEELLIPYDEIAILSRSTHSLKMLETEFERNNIPYVGLISDQYSADYKQKIQQYKIVLSTIHKAKGLEWRVVFIFALSDQCFPSHLNNGIKQIDEERRLFYVAVTRAKQFLHFVSNSKEVPLSRFIGEVEQHVNIIKKTDNIPDEGLFIGRDDDHKKDSYSVINIIERFSGKKIEKLRELNLIPVSQLITTQLFSDQLCFTNEIKQNIFESDYALFCNYYLTRQLMINNKQTIKDSNSEKILTNLHLTEDEKQLYYTYNLKNYLLNIDHSRTLAQINIKAKRKDLGELKLLIKKLLNCMKTTGIDALSIENLMSLGSQDYNYPDTFLGSLGKSYEMYRNNKIKIENILNTVYYVSLCPKFNDNRRRLLYRDILDLFKKNSMRIFPRIDEYVKLLKNEKIKCKLHVNKLYKLDKYTVSLSGEIDYVNITNDTIVMIKCSESEFKLDWLLELMLYYSLFNNDSSYCVNYYEIDIKKVAVFNILNGKYYELIVPENYNWMGLLEFVGNMIFDDLKGVRASAIRFTGDNNEHFIFTDDCINVNLIISSNNNFKEQNENTGETIILECSNELKSGYMVLDIENNCTNQDIIQVAYILYDLNHNVLKCFNSYIKNRFVDKRTKQITGITTDVLRKSGISFNIVMREFFTDLNKISFFCGHHVHTDVSKIRFNLEKYMINVIPNILDSCIINDTQKLYKIYKKTNKNITLGNMYKELFGKNMIGAHDALIDVEHTAKCYVELLRLIDEKNQKVKKIKDNNTL